MAITTVTSSAQHPLPSENKNKNRRTVLSILSVVTLVYQLQGRGEDVSTTQKSVNPC